jgi:hypothetical protein
VAGVTRLRGRGCVVAELPRSRRVPTLGAEPRVDVADEVRLDGVRRGVARPCGGGIGITPLVGTPEATGRRVSCRRSLSILPPRNGRGARTRRLRRGRAPATRLITNPIYHRAAHVLDSKSGKHLQAAQRATGIASRRGCAAGIRGCLTPRHDLRMLIVFRRCRESAMRATPTQFGLSTESEASEYPHDARRVRSSVTWRVSGA